MTPPTMDPTVSHATPSAVVWIDEDGAVIASVDGDGQTAVCDFTRGALPTSRYLEQVIRAMGDRRRVMILGPDTARLALEREYVAVFHRRERLIDVEQSPSLDMDELLDLARLLAT